MGSQSKDKSIFNFARRERIQKALSVYLEKSSVSGVSFIIGTKYLIVRAFWTILLIVALIGMTIHLGLLFSQYASYQKSSSTDLYFSVLPLPAVTFCNVNPIRMSKLDRASPSFGHLVRSFDPDKIRVMEQQFVNERPVPPAGGVGEISVGVGSGVPLPGGQNGTTDRYGYNAVDSTTSPAATTMSNGVDPGDGDEGDSFESERLDSLFGNFDFESFLDSDWNGNDGGGSSGGGGYGGDGGGDDDSQLPGLGNSGGDDGNGDDGDSPGEISGNAPGDFKGAKDKNGKDKPKKKSGGGTMSSFRKVNSVFRIMYGAEPLRVRTEMGHQLKHLHINCDVADRKCKPSDFKQVSSHIYGNCYTLQYHDLLVSNDGPMSGLDLILYLQGAEHIKGFTSSTGIQVMVHEPGTIPFPEDEGFSVAAGTHTMVGLKMQDISRLGAPHGDCSDVQDFKEKYGVSYTRQTCQKLCQTSQAKEKCGCVDVRGISLAKLLNLTEEVKPCRSRQERDCITRMQQGIKRNGKRTCLCTNPCSEKKYVKTISSRLWPNKDYAKVFVSHICGKGKELEMECEALKNTTGEELRQQFLKLSIYYEDLNYEQLTERPNYKLVQLLCDVGGSIGLWIGLSLLSLFEILHLISNVLVSACCHGTKRRWCHKLKQEDGEKKEEEKEEGEEEGEEEDDPSQVALP